MAETYKTSERGIMIIEHFERLHDGDLSVIGLQPKLDPVGIWTIGYGHAIVYEGRFLKGAKDKALAYSLYPALTIADAEDWLAKDLKAREDKVNGIGLTISQHQFDALVSFVYNVGFGAFMGSTLLRCIMSGKGDITAAFAMFNKGTVDGVKQVLPGLTLRRADEAKLFLS